MNEHTYWSWVVRGFEGLVNMMSALVKANVGASAHHRGELEKVRDMLTERIEWLKEHEL